MFPLPPAVLRKWMILIVLSIIFSGAVKAQELIITGEKGNLPVYNYSTKLYKAAPQNWSILQGHNGLIYFGNNQGVMEYDGVNWRLIKVTNETNVRSLAQDKDGRIYVGAAGEIGLLAPNNKGDLVYQSLLDKLSEGDRDFADVWSMATGDDGIYFQTDNKIFRWNDKGFKVWDAEVSFHRIFYVNGTLWVRQREKGLMIIKNDELHKFSNSERFADESIYSMLPASDDRKGAVIACTKNNGLMIISIGKDNEIIYRSAKTDVDPFFNDNICYNYIQYGKYRSIATLTSGSVLIDSTGKFSGFLNKLSGLQDETVYSQYQDNTDNLWLATSNGVSRVVVNSPVTGFSDQHGLGGTVEDIVRHQGVLFVATIQGVFYLKPGLLEKGSVHTPPSFERIESTKEECWDLLSFKTDNYSTLLAVSSNSILSIGADKNATELLKCLPWALYRSKANPNRVYIALENGVGSILWDGSKWIEEATLGGVKESIHSLAEDKEGNLWLGHYSGVVHVKLKYNLSETRTDDDQNRYIVEHFDNNAGLPAGTVLVENNGEETLFGTASGIYRFNGSKFVRDDAIAEVLSAPDRLIHRIKAQKGTGRIWIESFLSKQYRFEFGYLEQGKDGNYEWNISAFLPFSKEAIHSIYHDQNGITWFGGGEGLFRYDPETDLRSFKHFRAAIRKVTTGRDSVIFNGSFSSEGLVTMEQGEDNPVVLPFDLNSVSFEFASLDFTNESAVQYQYMLEGFDKGWSNWKSESKAVYTNLPEGEHVFRVRSKNIYNRESIEATYAFSILPPWYRTWWAYVSYVLLSVAFVYTVVTMSTRGLKAIIRERTAEIVKQKEVIEYKNRNITDSINYAKRIQEAILPPRELMRSRFPDSFILYRPKDIVAGDFYWFAEKDDQFMIAACDCTGHGVPGAFMSLISYSLLNEVLLEKEFRSPAKALDDMKRGIIKSLGQTGQEGEQKDGMDMSLICVGKNGSSTAKMSFAGANNPIYVIRNKELIEMPADKMPIGIYLGDDKPFTDKEFELQPGDSVYMFSDGYADQFGGDKGKKFTKKRFKELLLSIQDQSMARQGNILETTMDQWLGEQQQIDDVLIIGIRVS